MEKETADFINQAILAELFINFPKIIKWKKINRRSFKRKEFTINKDGNRVNCIKFANYMKFRLTRPAFLIDHLSAGNGKYFTQKVWDALAIYLNLIAPKRRGGQEKDNYYRNKAFYEEYKKLREQDHNREQALDTLAYQGCNGFYLGRKTIEAIITEFGFLEIE